MWFVWILLAVLCVAVIARNGYVPPEAKHWAILSAFGKGALEAPQPKLLPDDVVVDRQLSDEDDVDLFEYREIADRVAELVAGAVHPVHVGVFGAWGAGKSSFLTLVQLRLTALAGARLRPGLERTPQFLVVRYDAWRYGGQALRRDLIAVAAKELKVKRRRYRAGLFESRQVVRLEMNEFIRRIWSFLMGVLVLLLGLGALVGIGALVLLILSGVFDQVKNPSKLVNDLSVNWGKVLAWLSAGLAVLSAPNLLGVTVNRSSPSQDDEFARNLKSLIREAELIRPVRFLARWTWLVAHLPVWCRRRVVFFIDELDRASDAEVLNTLTALQTQFADANVSVIVAADREVIEKALENRETQRRPERAWDPYLSGSDSFLDKVFQHTLVLPPLRTERLTQFARTQVTKDDGLWNKIDTEGATDDVLYALIPSHVHSPRRIKVLLNAYATQSRVAEARRLPVSDLRLQLALWVVLQLEFPRFAADLKVEPTLRRVMLEPTAELAGKLNRMYSRHRTIKEPEADAKESDWLEWSYRNQLHEYLEATNQVPDIPFDLLFLEKAGSAIGRFSEEVATALDRADRMEPSRVLSAIGSLDDPTLDRAIQFVAERSRAAISVGRDRAVLVMAGLIAQHSAGSLGRSAAAALDAFRRYTPLRPVPSDAVVAQVRVYIEAAPGDLGRLLATVETRDDAPHLAVIAKSLIIPKNCGPDARTQLTNWFGEHMSPLVLSALANSGKFDLIEWCMDRYSHGVLVSIRDLEARHTPDEDEDTESVAAAALTASAAVEPDEAEVDYESEEGFDLLDAEAVRALVTNLSTNAANRLAQELTKHVATGGPTPDLATYLLYSNADTATKGALATAIIIADPDLNDLEDWMTYAVDDPDSAAQAEAANTLLGRLTPATDINALSATFSSVTRLTNDRNLTAIAEAAAASLTNAEWTAGDEPARAAYGAAVINWMAEDRLPGYRKLALREARAKLPHALFGALPMATLTQNLGHLGKPQVEDFDRDLQTIGVARRDEPVPALRGLATRLILRRRFPDTLEPIPHAAVTRIYNSTAAATGAEATAARRALLDEWFAVARTDREVVHLIRNLEDAFPRHLAAWMPTATTTQATNAWVQASKSWNAIQLGLVTRATQLDTTKVANRMRELAGSENADLRKKALALARHFPKTGPTPNVPYKRCPTNSLTAAPTSAARPIGSLSSTTPNASCRAFETSSSRYPGRSYAARPRRPSRSAPARSGSDSNPAVPRIADFIAGRDRSCRLPSL